MKIYNYDINGRFISESIADESPLEEGVFLIPSFATTKQPLANKEGFEVIFCKNKWIYVEINSTENIEVIKEEYVEETKSEKETEALRVGLIKSKANELIIGLYPTFKQLNIIRLGGNDLIKMGNFIDSIRTISNEAELNGTALEDINWTV